MRLDETPEEELERMGEGFSLSTGVWNASIPEMHLPEPRTLNMSEEGAAIGSTMSLLSFLPACWNRTACSSSP